MITLQGIASSMRRFGFFICWILGLIAIYRFIERKKKSQKITSCLFAYIIRKSESGIPDELSVYLDAFYLTRKGEVSPDELRNAIFIWVNANFALSKKWHARVLEFRERKSERIRMRRQLNAA